MLTTPVGKPASNTRSASRSALSGVCSAALSTTVQPAANAGAIFHAAISSGKFHGMICPTTPTGSRTVYDRNSPGNESGMVEKLLGWLAQSRVDSDGIHGFLQFRISRGGGKRSHIADLASCSLQRWT